MSEPVYTVNVARSAQKEIRALDETVRVRVIQSMRRLAAEPRPFGCRKLVSAISRWRIRIGDYRLIYAIDGLRLKSSQYHPRQWVDAFKPNLVRTGRGRR